MLPINFPEAAVSLGRPSDMTDEECGPLPVARGIVQLSENSVGPAVISAWKPTPEELAMLNAGGPIYLHVIGRTQPPVMLSTRIEAVTIEGQN